MKGHKEKPKTFLGKVWHFIWEEDSVLSWTVNIVLAFLLIKYLVYPGLGLVLATTHPVVAVVSGSMEHGLAQGGVCGAYPEGYRSDFSSWWGVCGAFYTPYNITEQQFSHFSFRNGFNTGDIIMLTGIKPENVKIGDVIVFRSDRPDPIIHRVIKIWKNNDGYHFQTKGDHNAGSGPMDMNIRGSDIIGKARFRIPFLGYIKIWFVDLLNLIGFGRLSSVFNAR